MAQIDATLALRVEKLVVGYGRAAPVLRGLDLRADGGQVTTVIGPNGAGESTLLKALAGHARPRSGRVLVRGIEVQDMAAVTRVRHGVGYCGQGRVNFARLTVEENLALAGFSLPRDVLRERLRQARADPLVDARWRSRVGDLSGGQQQSVEIAMALMTRPSVLLLDEPSLGLSPAARREVFARARSVADEGTCVVVVEQNVRAATEVTDRLVVLDRGVVALAGPPRQILSDERLRTVYVGGLHARP
ncbi:ABC transporter ATP-binding protein [Sphaerisporangium sp. NPDC051011]|uniref:branched-chain amino acid ABC transporter ATP-binding protein n=1 Tax=Sphaerisporangium sp. NPDC051011 TaxID=3155792 RepID=UPI00340FA4C3